jgi:phenylpyruvate tautomerase PptA (4-oxalocrotonate tautomerase family)
MEYSVSVAINVVSTPSYIIGAVSVAINVVSTPSYIIGAVSVAINDNIYSY